MKKIIFRLAFVLAMFTAMLGCSSDSGSTDCTPITCLNGGTFVNCHCDCPQGYTGDDCSTLVMPVKIRITKISVITTPIVDETTGFNWDFSGLPDIYINVDKGSTNVYTSTSYYADFNGTGHLDFIPTVPIELTGATGSILSIHFYDYDGADTPATADDFMHTIYYSPYVDITSFAPVRTISENGYKIEVTQTYEW